MNQIISISLLVICVFIFSFFYYEDSKKINPNSFSFDSMLENLNSAGVYFIDIITSDGLRDKYFSSFFKNKKVKILIVPGHDTEQRGAHFMGIDEEKMNVWIAQKLKNYLSENKNFDVLLSRDENGYNRDLIKYIEKNRDEILEFRQENIDQTNKYLEDGKIAFEDSNYHNYAPSDMLVKLWGINKWANENRYDIVLHIHFNDYPGRKFEEEGKYNGFSVYVPDEQFSNHKASIEIAEYIKSSLEEYFPISNLPKEADGIIETHELIAIGSFNALDTASMLLEYGYIYEPQFNEPEIREIIFDELAYLTSIGIHNFFEEKTKDNTLAQNKYRLNTFQKNISKNLSKSSIFSADNLILQIKLSYLGFYPPADKNYNDCPLRGQFGICTEEAVKTFQKNNNLRMTGVVGPTELHILNNL
jgi:N-acetylmuramoyl-L-alanine amidase